MQIVSLRFCHIGTKKERSVAFKIRQNPFSAGADPVGGAHDAPPDPLVAGEGTPLPISHFTRHRSTLDARHASPRIPARSTPIETT